MIAYEPKKIFDVLLRLRGTVLPRIAGPTLLVALIGVGGHLARTYLGVDLAIPDRAHAIVGVGLGLLLVFRTNASYDRFWEGRKLMGALVNQSRDLARQAASYLPPEGSARVGRLVRALYATIRRYLRHERTFPELEPLLEPAERAAVLEAGAPPLLVARLLSDELARLAAAGQLGEHRLQLMDTNLTRIIEAWGGAERILRTPMPLAYAHHIKLFLLFFCLTVPLAFLAAGGWFAPVGAVVVAIGLFGIDEIGVEIEDPFGYDPNDLPLDAIGERIDKDVEQTTAANRAATPARD